MATAETNPYDAVPYPSHSLPQTHPDRLATVATLCGMSPAPPARCRLLELGCGDGTNVLSMAAAEPASQFVGVDLAARPIAAAKAAALELGLANAEFHEASVAALPPEIGTFDYVTAHGVYSWVPPGVREALMAAVSRHLAPGGVAYLSYSVFPGGYLTRMLREMMLLHVRDVRDDGERIRQSLALLKLLAAAGERSDSDPWRKVLESEVLRVTKHDPGQLRHDELGDVNEPVWWWQFATHARRNGLAFLAEADWFEGSDAGLSPAARQTLAQIGRDRITREQYLDFCKCRRFRQTLLVAEGTAFDPNPAPEIVRRFLVSASVQLPQRSEPLGVRAVERFEGPNGGGVETDAPIVRAAMRVLEESWPHRLWFDEIAERARRRIAAAAPEAPPPGAEDEKFLEHVLFRVFETGLVRLHLTRPSAATGAPERPASPHLARLQARSRSVVTSLFGENVALEDDGARQLLRLLDGTRDRSALLADLRAAVSGLPAGAAPSVPVDPEGLERALANLAKFGLVEA